MTWNVHTEDREHYGDPESRRLHSTHESHEAALAEARRLVDQSLEELRGRAKDAGHLFELWSLFGEDAYLVPDAPGARFSGQDYARRRAAELADPARL